MSRFSRTTINAEHAELAESSDMPILFYGLLRSLEERAGREERQAAERREKSEL